VHAVAVWLLLRMRALCCGCDRKHFESGCEEFKQGDPREFSSVGSGEPEVALLLGFCRGSNCMDRRGLIPS